MKKKLIIILTLFLFVIACKTVPFTGRKQVNFMPNSQLFPMAFAQYDEFLKEHKKSTNRTDAQRIKTIGKRIVQAANKYLNANNYKGYLKDYKWEFNLVKDEQLNAWCMPGGKVVFYEGILPVCKTDDGIATVMGHEIAHAIANHGAERASQGMLVQAGQVGVAVATSKKSQQEQQLWMLAYGVTANLGVMLPFSRKHESEADAIGLTLMAIAGYNPNEAITFWGRMSKKGGGAPPEFLSTHPSNKTRIANLKKLIPKAIAEAKKYK